MNNNESLFDVIDLDPYGSVIPFIEAGLRASKDGGLICATCTDLKVLEGPDVFKCFAMYNVSRAYGIGCKPENAIRIVLHSI
jgi:tRNA (guanine26-N2/guanine27-N2)-dimethyltransferase